ncbi:MAG: hypothetical protein WKG07_16085 [Hymenobacter sp.]
MHDYLKGVEIKGRLGAVLQQRLRLRVGLRLRNKRFWPRTTPSLCKYLPTLT